MRASIYTRKGDFGETGLVGGTRVPKNDALIEALGAVDELNATLGQVKSQNNASQDSLRNAKVKNSIQKIQSDLFAVGAVLAGYDKVLGSSSQVLEKRVRELEKEIDEMWAKMPPLKNFILPKGQLHLARAVCRRAERAVVRVPESRKVGPESVVKYLNRLSDYLFCLARWVNFKAGEKETIWRV